MTTPSAYERAGGAAVVEPLVREFVHLLFRDPMIGFFFRQADEERVFRHEYELAVSHLGGPLTYEGRPLAAVHARFPIARGQFRRRIQLLKNTLAKFALPEDVRYEWIRHDEALEGVIVGGSDACPAPPLSDR